MTGQAAPAQSSPGLSPSEQAAELALEYLPAAEPCGRPPLVLLHGWGHSRQCWQALLPDLTREQDVYNLDLPGFGDNADWQLPELEDALAVLAELLPDQCVLVGWSLGGHLALRLATQNPGKVAGVITLATNLSFVASDIWPQAMPPSTFEDFAQAFDSDPAATLQRFCGLQAQGDRHRKTLLRDLRKQCLPPEPGQRLQWRAGLDWLAQIDHRQDLANLTRPSLQLFGGEDALVPAAAAQAMKAIASGAVVSIADAGHAPHLTHTEEVARHIRHFLEKLAGPEIDKQRMARSFSRAAETYDSVAHVQTQVGARLLQQSPSIKRGETLLDIGCGTGFCSGYFRGRGADVTGLDIAPGMLNKARQKLHRESTRDLHWVCADAEQLPFSDNCFSGAVSSLTVQWSEDLPRLFRGIANSLKPGGWLLLSTLGPNTLQELRSSWSTVDSYTHVNSFASATELEAALNNAGLCVEMFSEEKIVPRYDQLNPLLRELKALGAHNVNARQNRGLTAPRYLRQLALAYEKFRGVDGKLPATYQVFYLRVRKPR
jgi:malonyl-CoA O-methyltransferase